MTALFGCTLEVGAFSSMVLYLRMASRLATSYYLTSVERTIIEMSALVNLPLQIRDYLRPRFGKILPFPVSVGKTVINCLLSPSTDVVRLTRVR